MQHTQTALKIFTGHSTMSDSLLICCWVYSYWWVSIILWWCAFSLFRNAAKARPENMMLEVVLKVWTDLRGMIRMMRVRNWRGIHHFMFLNWKYDLWLNSLCEKRMCRRLAYRLILRMLNEAWNLRRLWYCQLWFPNCTWSRSLFKSFIKFIFPLSCRLHSL